MLNKIVKPWYVYRPSQLLRRFYATFLPKGERRVELAWGGKLLIDTNKEIGRSIVNTGVYDLPLSEMLYRLVGPGDAVLDVGANVGYTTALLSFRVGTGGRVIAIEAHPEIYARLCRNVELLKSKGLENVVPLHCAVSEHSGDVLLECSEEFESNDGVARVVAEASPNSISVHALPLDEIVDPNCQFKLAKIDVEGHEISVLRGATRCLATQIEHVVYEDHHPGISDVTELLQSRGLHVFQFGWTLNQLRLAGLEEPSLVRPYEPKNLVATRNADFLIEKCRKSGWRVLGH